jgi:hypothetical protein
MKDLHNKVLAALKESTSANSIAYADLMATTNAKDKELFSIMDSMYEAGIVNRCYITKAGRTDNYYWLTGFKGKAKSKGPEPTGIKKEVSHKAEPRAWSAIKNIQQQSPALSAPNSTIEKESDMKKTANISKQIKEAIEKTPGIAFSDLVLMLTNGSTDPAAIQKAKFNIEYVARQTGYMKRKTMPIGDGEPVTTLWRTVDWDVHKKVTDIPKSGITKPAPIVAAKKHSMPEILAEPAEQNPVKIPAAVTIDATDTDYCIKRISEQLSDDATIVISKEKGGAILVTVTHAAHIYKPNLDNISACLSAIQTLASLQVSLPN